MTKAHYLFFGVIIAALVFLQIDTSKRVKLVQQNKEAAKVLAALETEDKAAQVVARPVVIPPEVFVKKFKSEALQIGKIQNKPEEAEKRLRQLATEMRPQDVEGMYEIISDENANGDQRALAVELLSMKNDTNSLIALQNFVANKKTINGTKWDVKKELETVLRAQAVESIATYPQKEIALSTLNYLQSKVDDKFLSERIGRATSGILTGNNKSSQQQDDEALKKLVE
jgi:hypothetical protein